MKRFMAICLSLGVMLTSANGAASVTLSAEKANKHSEPPGLHRDVDSFSLEQGTYREGDAIITIATPRKTNLTKKGILSSDRNITIDEAWNFGAAEVLGANEEQKEYLQDKDFYIIKASSDSYTTEELLSKLDSQEYVISVEPNYYQEKREVNDAMSGLQWSLDGENTESEGIHYSELDQEKISVSDSNAPVVAVVDTGIDYTHEDLADRMWKNPYPDDLMGTYGYDFGNDDADPADEDGHGTHCAGIIAASVNNGMGIAGISTQAKLMALKIFNDNDVATNESVINAFYYIYEAQQLGVNIAAVNCSWGGGESSSVMSSLIDKIGEAGAVFVFAAGNDNVNHDTEKAKECPYDISSPYVVRVGASDTKDQKACYSDYGTSTVDLFAPGSQILSTVSYDTFYPALLSASARDEACAFYSAFDDGSVLDSSLYYTTATGLKVDEIQYSEEDMLGDTGSGSLSVQFSASHQNMPRSPGFPGNQARGELNIYLDVTDLGLSSSASYYVACDMGEEYSDGLVWSHTSYLRTADSFYTSNGHRYLRLVSLNASSSTIIYLDNISVSTADLSEDFMCKYSVYSGTSMAAPAVSSAFAILSALDAEDDAVQRIEKIYSCVRKTDALSDYCVTGGILDLSRISDLIEVPAEGASSDENTSSDGGETADASFTDVVASNNTAADTSAASAPAENYASQDKTSDTVFSSSNAITKIFVKKLKINKKKAVLRYGKKLKLRIKAKPAKASNKKIKWSVSNKKYAKVSKKGVVRAKKAGIGHTVKVYAKTRDGSGIRVSCKVKITKAR